METNKAERLEQAVATLDELIELAEGCGLRESAQFLAMAKLHLQIDLNEVTDIEFRALCDAARRQGGQAARSRARSAAAQPPRRRTARHAPRLAMSAGCPVAARRPPARRAMTGRQSRAITLTGVLRTA